MRINRKEMREGGMGLMQERKENKKRNRSKNKIKTSEPVTKTGLMSLRKGNESRKETAFANMVSFIYVLVA